MFETKGVAPTAKQHGDHVLLLFGKYLFWAFIMAWITLISGGLMLLSAIFIVEYQFIMETSFSLDTGWLFHSETCWLFMFIMELIYMLELCNMSCNFKSWYFGTNTLHYSWFQNKLWVENIFTFCHGGPLYVCISWIDFQNVSASFDLLLQLKDNGVSNAFWNSKVLAKQ